MDVKTSRRFWSKVKGRGGCWLWTAAVDHDGYGMFKLDGTAKKAHRVAYQLTYGKVKRGLNVLHRCDDPLCVRPVHLFLGTHLDNVADRVQKGRCARGEANGRSKLTAAHIQEIREAYARGGVSLRALG